MAEYLHIQTIRWCDNYARGILQCHLAWGGTFLVMEEKICSFFGHRNVAITEELYAITTAEIVKSVDFGCRVFYFGGFGDFDDLCYQIVTKIKQDRPHLALKRVFCVPQERYLRKKAPFFHRENYEEVRYLHPMFEGWYKSIYYRNCAIIEKSVFIIFYAETRQDSGAYKAYQFAKKQKEKYIVNLWRDTSAVTK